MSEETKESMEYDLISVSAARDWLNKSSRNEHSERVAQVLKDFCEHVRLVECSSSSSSTPTQPSSPVAEEPWPVIDIRVLFSVLVRFVVFVVRRIYDQVHRLSPKNHQTSRNAICRRKHNFVSRIAQ